MSSCHEKLPVCSVIVPSYRSMATIGACLRALLQQDITLPYEIIVVDSSPDATPEIVRRDFPQVRLIHRTQQTDPAQARNIGAATARGATLAFIDSDCVAARDWLRRLHTALKAGYDAAGGAITNANGETLASWASYLCEFREFLPGGLVRDADNLTLGNAAYRREPFLAQGGFPVGYFPQEDQVFHQEMRRRGGRIRYDPGVVVAHTHRDTRPAFLAHQRRIGQANARTLQRTDGPGARFARRRSLAALVLPLLVPVRWARTLYACRALLAELRGKWWALASLCLQGMCWWGAGFLEGSVPATHNTRDSEMKTLYMSQ